MKTPAEKTMTAFWRQVDIAEGDPCWVWKGQLAGDGSPLFAFAGTAVKATRFLYEAVVGKLPASSRLVPSCGNALCVNTDHVEPRREVTTRDGDQRAVTARDGTEAAA
jgi:hypothetical protein